MEMAKMIKEEDKFVDHLQHHHQTCSLDTTNYLIGILYELRCAHHSYCLHSDQHQVVIYLIQRMIKEHNIEIIVIAKQNLSIGLMYQLMLCSEYSTMRLHQNCNVCGAYLNVTHSEHNHIVFRSGGLINAPISHYWFEWLSINGPSSSTASVLVDQLVVQPPLLVCKYYYIFLVFVSSIYLYHRILTLQINTNNILQ